MHHNQSTSRISRRTRFLLVSGQGAVRTEALSGLTRERSRERHQTRAGPIKLDAFAS